MMKRWRVGLFVLACCALVGLMVVATPGTFTGSAQATKAPAEDAPASAVPSKVAKAPARLADQVAPAAGAPALRFTGPSERPKRLTARLVPAQEARLNSGLSPFTTGPNGEQIPIPSKFRLSGGPLQNAQDPGVTVNVADGLEAGEGWADPNHQAQPKGQTLDSIRQSKQAQRENMVEVSNRFDDGTAAQGGDQVAPGSLFPLEHFEEFTAGDRPEGAPGAATSPVNVRDYPRSTISPYNTRCADGAPPDVDMGVGVDWVITNYNSYFTVYNKAGTRQFAAAYESIAASAGLSYCGATAGGWWCCDPQTLYDDQNDRYVLIWLATNGSDSRQCLAVTKTNDPRSTGTANWWAYQYDPAGSTTLDDYPHGGIGEDAIFVGINRFVGGSFSTSAVVAFNKTKAYNGTLGAVSGTDYVDAGISGYRTPQPAERRGYGQGQYPPAGTPHYICTASGTGALDIYRWNMPTMSNTPALLAASVLGSPGSCNTVASTAVTSTPVDVLSDRYMDCEVRWPYLYTVRTGADASATYGTIQWAQVNMSSGSPVLTNSNEYSRVANSSYNWMPDVTADKEHNMAFTHTFADDTGPVFIGGYIAGREFGDAANTMSDGGAVVAGGKVYNCGYDQGGTYRWGDYNGCAVDPDGCTIWVTTEFVENNSCTYCDATQLRNYKFASCSVTNSLLLDDNRYTCSDTLTVTVSDITTHNSTWYQNQIAIQSSNGDDERINAANWVCLEGCSGGNGTKWQGSIPIAAGAASDYNGTLNVANGNTITVTYNDTDTGHPDPVRTATVDCSADLEEGGYLIYGGCDNDTPYTPPATAPEMYNKYMDAGEYPSYTYGIFNNENFDLTDVRATLSVTGPGASYVTVYNPTVNVGGIAAGTVSGAVFNLRISPTTPNLQDVTMNLSVTSPADGLTTATVLTQAQVLEADDVITTQHNCWTHNSGDMTASVAFGYPTNPWRQGTTYLGETITANSWYGSALNCGNATAASYSTSTANTTKANFATNAWEAVIANGQPALRGNAPNGRPYNYTWLQHGFYTAIEASGNTSGVWGVFYNDQWNNATAPTGDDVYGFPISVAWYLHSVFDWDGSGSAGGLTAAGWDSSNTGTPDDPVTAPPVNQLNITFGDSVRGPATNSSYFSFGHFHVDGDFFGVTGTHRDIGLDNDHLIYHQYYAGNDAGTCPAGSQVGQVSFDSYRYNNCPSGTATIMVLDDNRSAPFTVTVTSSGGGDSELVTMSGSAPYFTGTLTLTSLVAGLGNNNGSLYCLTSDDLLTATYTDNSPAGTSTAYARFYCAGGDVVYVSNTQVSDNGDNDGIPDNNETVVLDITIQNNMGDPLTNTVVTIETTSPNIDCITDATANYGTVAGGGATATNPSSDRFAFHVASTVQCSNWQAPPTADFIVTITGDDFYGSSSLQQFVLSLDLDNSAGGTYTYTQAFSTDPGWSVYATPDEDGACTGYTNNFAYRPDGHGSGNGCYGAWLGTGGSIGATGTSTGLNTQDSSTLESPVFTAAGNVTLSQDVAFRLSATYNGAKVQARVNNGAWTNVAFTTPAQSAITTNASYCYPGDNSPADSVWWSAAGQNWTTTNTATITASNGQPVQFRWRIGIDSTGGSSLPYSGLGVDNISIGNLRQTQICEPTRNSGLPNPCSGCLAPSGMSNNTAADANACTDTGVTVGWSAPGNWNDGGSGTRTYDVLRGGSPIATGLASSTTSYTDTTGTNGTSYTYTVRANNGCGSSYTTTGASAMDFVSTAPSGMSNNTAADANACTDTGVTVGWSAPGNWNDGGTGTRTYDVLRDGSPITTGLSAATTSYTDTTGTNGTSYTYTVRAVNGCGTTYTTTGASAMDFVSTAPSGMSNNTAADVNSMLDTGVLISWSAPGNWNDGGTGTRTYDVLRNAGAIATGLSAATTSYTDTTGVNGTVYTYTVRANNGCGTTYTTAGATAADYIDPGPTAGGTTPATSLGFVTKTSVDWPDNANAATYNLVRGQFADLPQLLNSSNDSCYKYQGATSSATTNEDPPAVEGDFFWYLVAGVNGGGGVGTYGDTSDAGPRVVNTPGACP